MKRSFLFVLFFTLFLFVVSATSNGFDMTSVGDYIYIESIDAIRIVNSPSPELRIAATFINTSDRTIRMKDGHFKLVFEPASDNFYKHNNDEKSVLGKLGGEQILQPIGKFNIGKTKIGIGSKKSSPFLSELEYFEIQSQSTKQVILKIPLPKFETERNLHISKLFNFLGFPGSYRYISLLGRVSIGSGGKRGWTYQDLSLIEFQYWWEYQSKVLFH